MSKPHWFRLNPKDFLGDEWVDPMTNEVLGIYFRLICRAWQSEPTGSLPNDDRRLANWARLDMAEWEKVKPELLTVFKPGDDGRLYQKRLREEYLWFAGKSRKASESARKRWDALPDQLKGTALDTPEFTAAWGLWAQHRREKKKPLTPTSMQQQCKQLLAWGHDRAIRAIRHSIAQGWQGIFEPKENGVNHGRPLKGTDLERQANAHYRPDLKAA